MLIEHRGSRPRVAPTAYVAPTAVVCGDVRLDEDVRVLFGAVISAEGGPVEVGSSSIVMEQAVVRGREGHPTGIGSHLLVGPHAVGDPAEVLPPDDHERIWGIQRSLDFPRTVYGVERGRPEEMMASITRGYVELFGRHRDDRIFDGDV
jgi:hypothetical protein